MDILTIKGLKKRFGEKEVLRELDMSVPTHSVFGFVGRNGTGKTTTMKAVLGLLRTDGGEIFVNGERVVFGQTTTNRHLAYLPDVPQFYPFMTPREYLKLCGESLGMDKKTITERSEELLSVVGLSEENRRIKGFSRGMKQRLGIAQALLSRPKLLICDEPTSALDPIGRKEILDILSSVKDQTTVIFSTHILSDVERICTDIALINNGVIAMQGSVDELKRMHRSEGFMVEMADLSSTDKLINAFSNTRLLDNGAISFPGDESEMYRVIDFIKDHQLPLVKVERAEASLESLFMEVVNK